MKTLYEKTSNLANYIRDIMYMQKYWMDSYSDVAKIRTARMTITPQSCYETVRGYAFDTTNPELEDGKIFQSLQRKSDYSTDYVMTLTSSYTHINNNTKGKVAKYHYVQYVHNHPNDLEQVLSGELRDLFQALRTGISTDTVRETEFQQTLVHKDYIINGFYLFLLLYEDLKKVQFEHKDVMLCLGDTDIRAFVPARKAFIDLLDQKVNNDWRQTILQRYGHDIG